MYRFFVKVTSDGGSNAYFGSYDLYVGCTAGSVTYSTNPSFVTAVAIFVGQNSSNVYTFAQPISSKSYCRLVSTEIVNTDGTAWTAPAKIVQAANCTTKPNCTTFDLVSSSMPDYILFKVKSEFDGGMTHLSPAASISIAAIFTLT